MNIFIVTLGSRGDVQPYVALGKGLQAAGHRVTLCTSSSFESFITAHGLTYGYMNNGLMDLMDTVEGRGAMEDSGSTFGLIRTYIKLIGQSQTLNKGLMVDSWQSAQAADPDLIIFHPKALSAPHIAEKLGVPAILALPVPLSVPTRAFPTVGVPELPLGGWYNKFTYQLVEFGYRSYAGVVNEFRQEQLGLGKAASGAGIRTTPDGRPIPVLHGISTHLLPRPADWPDYAHITGYWFLDQPDDWQPPDDLTAFLDAGEPPVYVGFGSMAGKQPERMGRLVADALQRAGVRGVLASGWGGLSADGLPESVFPISQAPHDWLFPRVAAVVHHGGAGTTAAGLRAGKPTIICPFFGDQFGWGRRVEALNVGPAMIPQKKLTAEKLAAAITAAVSTPSYRERAESLSAAIHKEDGIGQAVALIERITAG